MPWRFWWEQEYWDGHLTPRRDHVRVEIRPRPLATVPPHLSLRSVNLVGERVLLRTFIEAFEDGVEFCDWPAEKIHDESGRIALPLRGRLRLLMFVDFRFRGNDG